MPTTKGLPGNDFTDSYDELLQINEKLRRKYPDEAKGMKVDPREFRAYCENNKSSIDGRARYTWASMHRFLTSCWATLEQQAKANQFEEGDSFDDN